MVIWCVFEKRSGGLAVWSGDLHFDRNYALTHSILPFTDFYDFTPFVLPGGGTGAVREATGSNASVGIRGVIMLSHAAVGNPASHPPRQEGH